jgi:signal peptidase
VALTLRGDANPVDDPAPYDVATVRVVLWSVPGAAAIIAGLGDPLVLGSLTVAMSALVLWSFWPRDPDGGRRRRTGAGAPGRHAVASMARGASGTGVVVLLATAAAIAAPSPPARAEPGEQVIRGRYIVLTTVADPVRMTTLSPGDTASLLLGVGTVPEAPGVVTLTLDVDAVDTALALRVVECDGPPVDGSCPDGRVVLAGLPLDAPSAGIALGEVPGHAGRWLRFDVSAPSSGLAQGARAELVVHARGFGEIVETGAGGADFASGPLATSGTDASSRVLLAAGVVAMGIVAASIGRRRLRRRRRGRGDGGLA